MSLLKITNLTFSYEGSYDNIFENVSLTLDTDWKLGLTGRNGRGKTTLLKLIAGEYAYSGSISANVNFMYFPYEVVDKQANTLAVIDNIITDYPEWALVRELNLLEVSPEVLYRPFDTLSNGEQIKVLLATMFLKENSFLLIDEPTNHLDMAGRQLVSRYLSSKSGYILVSHDRAFLDNCVDHILSINKTGLEVERGNLSSWMQNKEMREQHELAENDQLKKDIKRLEAASKRTASWSDKVEKTKHSQRISGLRPDRGYIGHKAAKMMRRSQNIEERRQTAIQEKSLLLKDVETAEALKIHPLKYHTNTLLRLENVTIAYEQKTVCADINLIIQTGDRIAVCGKNGSGKSSLLKLICGEAIPFEGRLLINNTLKISCVSQDTSDLSGSLNAYAEQNNIDESLFKAILRKLDFSRSQFEKDMCNFSGGQKKKVLIARSLCEQAHLYIWDEPLNYIDVFSRMQIESLVKTYQPTMLFVEHDSAFCAALATKKLVL